MTSDTPPPQTDPATEKAEARLATRRQSLMAIGRFAAATAPAMLVLLNHGTAAAKQGADDEGEKSMLGGLGEDRGDNNYNSHTGRHSHS